MASDYALSQVHAPKICKVGTHVEPCATCDAAHGRPASCTVKGRAPLMEPDRRNRCTIDAACSEMRKHPAQNAFILHGVTRIRRPTQYGIGALVLRF